ncbi:E3 ubiquitin-protein ligase RNF43 [Takifugu flavidus]|uniref:E3 ubiquitin-protein ligase RNF43 n=1 Tax=Takifugu flavidus TaxID=433684 RepID=A0A5C6PNX8_9TELE|nr:E3 ubiquitin-protein ligase RNF43 [Takifugu flavidus]
MDSIDGSFDYSFSVDSPTGLNQGFLLNTDNATDSNMYGVIPETPSPQPSKRRRSDREEHLNPEAVSSSSSEELFSSGERKSLCSRKRRCLVAGSRKRSVSLTASPEQSIFDLSPTVRTLPEESYLSSASSTSSSVVELDVQVVDSPVASPSPANSPSPEADRTRSWESLTMSAASSASPLPAALQSDFLFSLTDVERRQLCGGHEENLAAVTEILDRSHARLEQEQADEEFARYLQAQFDEEQASSRQQQRSYRYHRSVHHNLRQREPQNSIWIQCAELNKKHSNIYLLFQALLQFEEQQGAVVVRSLSSQEISRFPTKKFGSGTCAGSAVCNVCLCDYTDGETLRTLPCLHSYHRDCIDHWLKDNPVCPVCRTDLTDSETLHTQHS